MPGPARMRLDAAVVANAECEACHVEIGKQWRASLHAQANTVGAYRRAFAIEPMPFCRACHAPEADPTKPPPNTISELGVGCVTCHLTDGGQVLATSSLDSATADVPHGVLRTEAFAGAQACSGCHEFRFPTAVGDDDGSFMQTTVREHQRSRHRDTSCADCHMPRDANGDRTHRFLGSRDEDFVRSAVEVSASRLGTTHVAVRLDPKQNGHAFPTGDLFRRLEVRFETLGPDYMVLDTQTRFLRRHLEPRSHGMGRKLIGDDRVFDVARVVNVDLGREAEERAVAWQVSYQRVAHPTGGDPDNAVVEAEIVLGRGILGPR